MIELRRAALAAFVCVGLAFAGACPAMAQTAAPAAAPANASAAAAGTYALDANHTAVIARVPHFTFSYEVFRFGGVTAALTWDPANVSANRLTATVRTATIQTPVPGFAEELSGARFLNVAQFPEATFTSTAFRRVDATHAQVDGTFTLMGVTKPLTFDVELIGAGQGAHGVVIGIRAKAQINTRDYALPAFIGTPITIEIDSEFDRQS